ncbi:MAG TPA: KOW motif-containing protein, partial [Thermoleophilaceae bacterium]
LHTATVEAKPRSRAEFTLGETVKVISGALSDFEGEVIEVNEEAGRLKVAVRERKKTTYSIGETVKVISGPLSDFSGEIAEINEDAAKLKVLVSIFGRETPVEVGFDQVKKV